jgi:(p)ppGpp synthase/HD superfamily hydrolase
MDTRAAKIKCSLAHAIDIAKEAHRDQLDKAGEPYILHPMRVVKNMGSEDEKIVAILHDVVEKNPTWTLSRLADEGFSEKVIEGADAMTRRAGESYEDFVRCAGTNPIARAVKLADLQDNLYMAQIAGLDKEHTEKYRRAIDLIKSVNLRTLVQDPAESEV